LRLRDACVVTFNLGCFQGCLVATQLIHFTAYQPQHLRQPSSFTRRTLTLYEADKHQPGAEALAGLYQVGADIVFILTGQRPVDPPVQAVDMDRLALSLEEARRQLGLPKETPGQREILDRAWVIYLAVGKFIASKFSGPA
jgi:hypothetical protein